ncbi:retrovirus-related pol polyprotein from transposon TNT 1-94, partial [Tanacetum coccineum]
MGIRSLISLYIVVLQSLQYLTFTWPDISYFMQQICLYIHDHREPHLAALKRVLRYVRGTLDFWLQHYGFSASSLVAYSDADWVGCSTTRRSTSGYYVFFGNNLLSWSSKRQHTLSHSNAKAEYRGVANVVAETAWLRNLHRDLHTPLLSATLVYCDNVSVRISKSISALGPIPLRLLLSLGSKELIGYLDFLYSGQKNISRIYSICKAFHRGEQQDQSLLAYVMGFKPMYEELNTLLPISADVNKMQKQMEQIVVMSFLIGLRPEFDYLRSQFLNESEIPSLQDTFARVLRNETVEHSHVSAPNSAFIIRGGSRGGFRGGSCGGSRVGSRGGHNDRVVDSGGSSYDNIECYYCHEMGHTTHTCKKLLAKKKGSTANIASSTYDDTVTILAKKYVRLKGSVNYTNEIGNTTNCLLSSSTRWIIDSGGSDNMTDNCQLLSDFSTLTPSPHVTIADGTTTRVLGSGTANPTPTISLSSILYLPKFQFNHLSVSKITCGSNCSVSFFPGYCYFQDLVTKKIIGR